MPDARECFVAQLQSTNAFLRALGCSTPVGGAIFEEGLPALIFGKAGQPAAPARLNLRPVGRRVEFSETWDYVEAEGGIVRRSYRYALFRGSLETEEPSHRFELHDFSSGRSRTIYGSEGFPHLHVGNDDHIPAAVSFEEFLRFVVVESPSLTAERATEFARLTEEAQAQAREWRID